MSDDLVSSEPQSITQTERALAEELGKGKGKKYIQFTMAVLGSLPWIGSFLSALANLSNAAVELSGETDQEKVNELLKLWVKEHQEKIQELNQTLQEIFTRLDNFGEEVEKRVQSPEYLALVRSAFRTWDDADTKEKREMIKRLITNAGATTLCPDDLVRLFIKWINEYHESHFGVIKEIFQNPGSTRGQIWDKTHTERPREDSPEADLFRYLIRDLSTGGVIRQEREVNSYGEFVKRPTRHVAKGSGSTTMESAFEDSKQYVLTELGKQFIHYVLNDVVPRIDN